MIYYKTIRFLLKIGIKAFKIGSGECNNTPLLEKIASFKKPIILSTGMNDLKSIRRSVKILKKKRINNKYFTIYFDKNYKNALNKYLNISFVMKKSVGNAVKRNKIKRKLKYAVQKISKEKRIIDQNYTYVIFGKNNVYKDKFSLVLKEVSDAFKKINQMAN